MTEYVTCPFCKQKTLVVIEHERTGEVEAECDCGAVFPHTTSIEAMHAVIQGTHYDGPEVV